jgi:nucleoside-diphosphate-sugar epimerase
MAEKIVVIGYGPVGEAMTRQLHAAGRSVTVAQRRRPDTLPDGVGYVPCDVLDRAAVLQAAEGATAVVCALGMAYSAEVWEKSWPIAMDNMLAACEATGARFLFIDNLYMYGPQTAPLSEAMPLTDYGRKPKLRAAITRQWQAAGRAGRVTAVALRAPDFYGPAVSLSVLGDASIGAMAKGKAAMLISAPDLPHAVAYVPDIARAAILLLDAPDDVYGQAWHVPCAPAKTPREILGLAARALGQTAKIRSLPGWLIGVIGLFQPFMKEWHEMRFQQQRPFFVDGSKFARRFGFEPTALEEGVRRTALAFRG